MPPKQNIPNVIGVPDNDDLRIMFNQIGTAIDNANANIGLLATQNQNLIQALAPHVADIANAVQNPVGLAGIEASLRHSSRPTLGPYTPDRPHQWTATSLDLIRYWDENLYLLLTDSRRTIADANADPPDVVWDQPAHAEYVRSKSLFLYIHAAVPLSVQSKIDDAVDKLCTDRRDELLRYSAYHAWQVIVRHDVHLSAQHLARLKSLVCC